MEEKPNLPPGHFDVHDELPEDELQEAYKRADEKLEKEHDKELTLEKSDIKVSGQEWVLVSFVGKNCSQKTDQLGMKVWGAFNDIDDAREHLKLLGRSEENRHFDIFILEMYCWAAIPPDASCIEDQEYHDEKLDNIIKTHKKEQYRAKEVFDTRKEKLMNNPDVNEYNRSKLQQLKDEIKTPSEILENLN